MQTIAQMLGAQGMERGLQKGRREGMQEVVRLLLLRFGELPAVVTQRVAAAEADELEGSVDRIIFAGSLDEVLRES